MVGRKVDPAKQERARQFRREMTPEEAILWGHLRGRRLSGLHFRRQQIIRGFITDFYCQAAGLVVEVDGPVHENQAEADHIRDSVFRAEGLRVLRFTNEEIFSDIHSVQDRIKEACRRGGDATETE